jgi:hypothetical protein
VAAAQVKPGNDAGASVSGAHARFGTVFVAALAGSTPGISKRCSSCLQRGDEAMRGIYAPRRLAWCAVGRSWPPTAALQVSPWTTSPQTQSSPQGDRQLLLREVLGGGVLRGARAVLPVLGAAGPAWRLLRRPHCGAAALCRFCPSIGAALDAGRRTVLGAKTSVRGHLLPSSRPRGSGGAADARGVQHVRRRVGRSSGHGRPSSCGGVAWPLLQAGGSDPRHARGRVECRSAHG